MVTVFSSDLN